jgi:hypothetical protein
MADFDAKDNQTFASQGFRFVITPDEFVVANDRSAYDPRRRRRRLMILISCAALSCGFFVGELFRQFREEPHVIPGVPYGLSLALVGMVWMFSLTWPWLPLLIALRALYPGTDELRCTKEQIRVSSMVRGRSKRVRDFSTSAVRRIQYVQQDFPWFGSSPCLGFRSGNKAVTCLPGLKAKEAQRILDELGRLGLDVIRDPDMPVMVEMEQSDRDG